MRIDGKDVIGEKLEPWFEHERTSELCVFPQDIPLALPTFADS